MYSDLDPPSEEIRVLDLYPGDWSDQIECQLRVVALKKRPTFKALSYVWGTPDPKKYIKVNGDMFAVTPSLCAGLQRLRSETEVLTLWVDAVCINQNNLDERSQQVSLMQKIYGSAEETLIWLGYGGNSEVPATKPVICQWTGDLTDMSLVDTYFLSNNGSDDRKTEVNSEDHFGAFVFLYLRSLGKHLSEMPFFRVQEGKLLAVKLWPATIRALDTFVSAPWWTRIWTLQETVLARRATLVYRNITAPWDMLARAAKASHIHDQFCCADLLDSRPRKEDTIIIKVTRAVWDDIELLRTLRAENRRMSLRQLVSQTDQRNATDTRDKFYGLLGLVTHWFGNPALYPDYTLEEKEAFMQATLVDIKGSYCLQALQGVPRDDLPNLPTWVTQISNPGRWNYVQKQRLNRATLFRAAGETIANVDRKGNILVVDAFEAVDTVTKVGPIMLDESDSWIGIIEVIAQWRNLIDFQEKKDHIYTRQQTFEEAFHRTILNDCIGWHPSETANEHDLEPGKVHSVYRRLRDTDLVSFPQNWWKWLQSQSHGGRREEQDKERTSKPELKSDLDSIRLFHQSFLGATALRRFFITGNGRMGLGPPSLSEGDIIRILLGGDILFALREASNDDGKNETLVGDVYVHGMMDGEGVPTDSRAVITQVNLE